MRSLDKGERLLLRGERGETGKPSTARTCVHEGERGGVKGKQREGGEEEEKGLQYFVIKGVKWGNEKEGGH
jgi:hypothetical protein